MKEDDTNLDDAEEEIDALSKKIRAQVAAHLKEIIQEAVTKKMGIGWTPAKLQERLLLSPVEGDSQNRILYLDGEALIEIFPIEVEVDEEGEKPQIHISQDYRDITEVEE